ncbi:unnamed protein product [Absidia cylindrospora]
MGDANNVMQQYSGHTSYTSFANDFYYSYADIDHSRRSGNHEIPASSLGATTSRQVATRMDYDRSNNLSKSLTSLAINVVFDLASGVKSRYVKSPTTTPDLQDDMYVYHKASDESKEDTQYIPSPPNSRRPNDRRPAPLTAIASSRSVQQHTRFLAYHPEYQWKFKMTAANNGQQQSRAAIKDYFDKFEAPLTWSSLPPRYVPIQRSSTSAELKMTTVMNKLKEEMERYTYLLDDTEKTMKEYENDIDVTLNQLQILEKKIKDMNLKTAVYTERQTNISNYLETITKDNNRVKSAQRKQKKLDDRIDKWKGERDPRHQFSFILTAYERMKKLDRYTQAFWDIGFYILIILTLLFISFVSLS